VPGVEVTDPAPSLTAADRASLAALAPAALPPPPRDVTNRYADDLAAATLGQRFFMDPGFSGALLEGDDDGSASTLGVKGQTGKVSCAGCHVPAAGFLDDRTLGKQISLAADWELRRTPSLLDVGQARLLMWDGRRDTLYGQIFGPLESANEMNSSRLFVAEQIAVRYAAQYEAVFGPLPDMARFPVVDAAHTGCTKPLAPRTPVCHGMPSDNAEYDGMAAADQEAVTRVVVNFGKAIGAYERLLSCGQSRFDEWVHGDPSALTHAEQRGAQLFVGKAQCLNCHAGPFLTDQQFHNVGLRPGAVAQGNFTDLNDRGAATGFAGALADALNAKGRFSDGDDGRDPTPPASAQEGAFRTPGLRCVSRRPSLMHTAQLRSIEDVVAFFDAGGHAAGYPGTSELKPLGLTAQERVDLAAFLRSLDGPGPSAQLLASP
jgi:cytochrome c peroxidase